MIDNLALDIVIGLIFIYLLYSLLATVLSEIIATYIGLRARNLKEAVDRMLNDEKEEHKGLLSRLGDSFKLTKNPKNSRITNFYNHPEIKYLGSTGIFKIPSQFKAVSFSKTLLNLLNETGYKTLMLNGNAKMKDPDEGDIKEIPVTQLSKERIIAALDAIIADHKKETGKEKEKIVLDEETAKYVLNLWFDSYGDLVKFKLHLEAWFDRTMEQCLEWYKRKIQIILLILGFMMAWFFNADTFTIISKLSKDDKARERLVSMANAYAENNKEKLTVAEVDGTVGERQLQDYNAKLDSLLGVKKELEQDIANANSILGLGGWAPDTVNVSVDDKTGNRIYTPQIDRNSLSEEDKKITSGPIGFDTSKKWSYFFRLFIHHFFGFLITAIAISLGAPFWFDLLNKIMKLRTSVKQDTNSTNTSTGGTVSPLNREA
ncbi:MAG: hypothetical protein ABI760_11125 [Ferruginibacter sp.]